MNNANQKQITKLIPPIGSPWNDTHDHTKTFERLNVLQAYSKNPQSKVLFQQKQELTYP